MTDSSDGRLVELSKWIAELSSWIRGDVARLEKRISWVEERLEQRMDARFALHEEMIHRRAYKR
jgi:hypothetical protein